MPVTALDPRTALVVIDLQQGIVSRPVAHVDDVVERTTALLAGFRERDLPVVLVNVAGTPSGRTDAGPAARTFPDGWTDLIPELDPRPGDLLVTKHCVSAFHGTGLAESLRERGVTQVVVTGVATGAGVESTARDAYDLGFHVTLPVDAMTDSDPDRHEYSVTRVFPRIAETGTTEDVLAVLRA
ncbi:isochorismatase family protein [Amycolatopsis thermophila]|uniref:Nicotinamidase-related amidase n=1 Tax=Amycolatopsis thermophila TaxID=206084 RepID=A0ABU0F0D6_9PSEU|nr:isochorismatase family protein [Amycolatopsis thermophila]MDQ0381018.1 nicotinamidase-related amidase [Amycolatopsis thermophila]